MGGWRASGGGGGGLMGGWRACGGRRAGRGAMEGDLRRVKSGWRLFKVFGG